MFLDPLDILSGTLGVVRDVFDCLFFSEEIGEITPDVEPRTVEKIHREGFYTTHLIGNSTTKEVLIEVWELEIIDTQG